MNILIIVFWKIIFGTLVGWVIGENFNNIYLKIIFRTFGGMGDGLWEVNWSAFHFEPVK